MASQKVNIRTGLWYFELAYCQTTFTEGNASVAFYWEVYESGLFDNNLSAEKNNTNVLIWSVRKWALYDLFTWEQLQKKAMVRERSHVWLR